MMIFKFKTEICRLMLKLSYYIYFHNCWIDVIGWLKPQYLCYKAFGWGGGFDSREIGSPEGRGGR
jgi:hypothetical protein